jgi:integrase
MKWKPLKNADGKGGVRYREHPTRKHGAVPDRYYAIAYWWQGKTVSEGIGWASEKWTPTKCFDLLAQIKKNQSTGKGPCTLAELRAQSETIRQAEQKENRRMEATLGEVWQLYVESRKGQWSPRHLVDHERIVQAGGKKVKRGKGKTKPGPLAPLMGLKLSELTPQRIKTWALAEAANRGTQARIAFDALRAFVNWCEDHPSYKGLASVDAFSSRVKKQTLPPKKAKSDCLQREQLPAWFKAVRELSNPIISAYLQALLLTGARREELAHLKWDDVDLKWHSMTIHDKVEGERTIPLTPHVAAILSPLARRNEWVFSSPSAKSGRLQEPRIPHNKALATAGIEGLTLHGLRRSFGTLSEWVEVPAGVVAQIMGHKPSATAEKHYRRRPLDLLRMWHEKVEAWILEQAGIAQPVNGVEAGKLQVVK